MWCPCSPIPSTPNILILGDHAPFFPSVRTGQSRESTPRGEALGSWNVLGCVLCLPLGMCVPSPRFSFFQNNSLLSQREDSQVQRLTGSLRLEFHPGLVWGLRRRVRTFLYSTRGRLPPGGLGKEAHGPAVSCFCPRAAWPRVELPGFLQVNEVVFSPSESHCATCGDDGSVRVWSLASMELVIQFQVLNQVLGVPGAEGVCLGWGPACALQGSGSYILPSACVCPQPWGRATVWIPRGVLMFPHRGSPELSLLGLEPTILRAPRAAALGGRLQRWHAACLQHFPNLNGTQDASAPGCTDGHCLLC